MNIKDLKQKEKDFKGKNNFIAEATLMPNANKNSTIRGTMFCAQLAQTPVLANNDGVDMPLVFTRFENEVGKYSSGYKKSKKNYKIIKKFQRNIYNYTLLVQDDEGNYDIVERTENRWITEKYGCKYKNDYLDNKKIGDEIKKDDIIYRNTSYDDYMNLGYGKNAKALYMAFNDMTHEDACVISESLAKKLEYYAVDKKVININTNDILLNIYGDKDNYKSFPDVGEEIINQELVMRRRIDLDKILTDLRDLSNYRKSDDVFYSKGVVTDIKVLCNSNVEALRELPYYNQIVKYIDSDMKYYQQVQQELEKIVEKQTDLCSNELIHYYNECKKRLDEKSYYTYQNNRFANIIIEFTLMELKKTVKGSKLSGRYGNKGVVSAILPDNEMPEIESGPFKGLHADICLNPLGVINRMNPGQLIEQSINFYSMYIRYYMNKAESIKDKKQILLDYYEVVSPRQKEFNERIFKKMNDEDSLEYIQELIDNGIPVHQGPFTDNINIYDLEKIHEKYGFTDETKFKFKGIKNRMIMGEEYIIRLKHDSTNKSSARSTASIDLKGLPAKDKEFKEGKALLSHTPIKLGEMEVANLEITNNIHTIKEILNAYGTNKEDSKLFATSLLTGNPYDVQYTPSDSKSITAEIFEDQYLKAIGLSLEQTE